MASNPKSSATIFLALNLLFFALITETQACNTCPGYPAIPPPRHGGSNGGLVGVVIGAPPTLPCCSLIAGLADLEAAVCLCTAIRANILGINLNVPLSLSLVLNNCGRQVPNGFTC
nr:14 kDa proline-rich protein DC2.15-like [Ipomoea trifida]